MNVGNPELVQGLNEDLAHEYQAVIISDETKHKEQAEKMLRGDWTSPTGAD